MSYLPLLICLCLLLPPPALTWSRSSPSATKTWWRATRPRWSTWRGRARRGRFSWWWTCSSPCWTASSGGRWRRRRSPSRWAYQPLGSLRLSLITIAPNNMIWFMVIYLISTLFNDVNKSTIPVPSQLFFIHCGPLCWDVIGEHHGNRGVQENTSIYVGLSSYLFLRVNKRQNLAFT